MTDQTNLTRTDKHVLAHKLIKHGSLTTLGVTAFPTGIGLLAKVDWQVLTDHVGKFTHQAPHEYIILAVALGCILYSISYALYWILRSVIKTKHERIQGAELKHANRALRILKAQRKLDGKRAAIKAQYEALNIKSQKLIQKDKVIHLELEDGKK